MSSPRCGRRSSARSPIRGPRTPTRTFRSSTARSRRTSRSIRRPIGSRRAGRSPTRTPGSSYDVVDYDINLSFAPDRRWFESLARLKTRIKTANTSQLTLRLADTLAVQSVTSDEYGALFSVRVRDQNTLLVNLPVALQAGTELNITVEYSGRVPGQTGRMGEPAVHAARARRAAGHLGRHRAARLAARTDLRLRQPQLLVSAGARLRLRHGHVPRLGARRLRRRRQRRAVARALRRSTMWTRRGTGSCTSSTAGRPLRNLSFLVTRLVPIERATVAFSEDANGTGRLRAPVDGRRRLQHAGSHGARAPAGGLEGSGARHPGRGHRAVLSIDHRRHAVFGADDCRARGQFRWRPQSRRTSPLSGVVPRRPRGPSGTTPPPWTRIRSSRRRTTSPISGGARPSAGRRTTISG